MSACGRCGHEIGYPGEGGPDECAACLDLARPAPPTRLEFPWVKLVGRKPITMCVDLSGRVLVNVHMGPNAIFAESRPMDIVEYLRALVPPQPEDLTAGCPCEECHRRRAAITAGCPCENCHAIRGDP
jgi:hypothetical protein